MPDIHGTARDKTVKELTFERARHIAERLQPTGARTRPAALPGDSTSARIQNWRDNHVGPWPNDPKVKRLMDAELATVADDDAEMKALSDSRKRADRFVKARRFYADTAQTAKKAICALVRAHNALQGRTPFAAALHYSDPKPTALAIAEKPLSESVAAYRLASSPNTDPPADPDGVAFARRRLYAVQGNPSLGRLFRFVIDFECKVSDLKTAITGAHNYTETVLDHDPEGPAELPKAVEQYAYFLLLRFCKDKGSRLWSTAKLRLPDETSKQKAGHFLPCTREEIDVRAMDPDEDVCANCTDKKACEETCKKLSSDVRGLAVAEQIDGIVDLGQHLGSEVRYQIIELDPIMATAAEDQKAKVAAENAFIINKLNDLDERTTAELNDEKKGTQRGGGLALADRWRQLHGIGRHIDSGLQKAQYAGSGKGKQPADIVLDASDLTAGYKLDVGVRAKDDSANRSRWHTLMHRTITYKPTPKINWPIGGQDLNSYITRLYPDGAARRDADDGQLQVPAALRDWRLPGARIRTHVAEEERNFTTVFMEEVIGIWRGDPLGLACGKQSQKLDPRDLRINMSYDLPTGAALTPPPLRFGWCYHFALRATFAGGISLPLNRALGHYEKSYGGELVQPSSEHHGTPFTRHERIDAPSIAVPDWMFGALTSRNTYTHVTLKGRFPVPQAGRMVLRSFSDPANRRIADIPDEPQKQAAMPGVGFDRRVLLAPPVSLDFAALHDAFRQKTGPQDIEKDLKILEPRVLNGMTQVENDYDTAPVDGEVVVTEFLPVKHKKDFPSTWGQVRVAWRLTRVESRPRGGLRNVNYRAAWGGLPIYRAKASAGLAEPKAGGVVAKAVPVTDEGEILYRVKGKGQTVLGEPLLWSAVGIFQNEEGQSDRSGAAVFQPLPNGHDEPERQPYYPDPAASTLVVQVKVRGEKKPVCETIPFYKGGEPTGSAPADYPNALPVVLDIVRGQGKRITVVREMDYADIPNTPPPGRALRAARVRIALAPGEEAQISCWCVPSEVFLTYMWGGKRPLVALAIARGLGKPEADVKSLSPDIVEKYFVEGIKALTGIGLAENKDAKTITEKTTFAGMAFPPPKRMRELAGLIRKRMLTEPVPEIAAVTEIEAVHAVDVPLEAPASVKERKWRLLRAPKDKIDALLGPDCKPADDPLCDPANWTAENQIPNAVDVLLDGSLTIHGPSTEAVEIRARGTAAARGRFDDVERGRSRDQHIRGLWPKPDNQAYINLRWLFGFDPAEDGSVNFEPESVTLLRIEGLTPVAASVAPGRMQIDLLDFQKKARQLELQAKQEKQSQDSPERALRPLAFPDGYARWIEIYAVAISRHATALRTRYDELPEVLTNPKPPQPGATAEERKTAEIAILEKRWLPATVRPARIVPLSPVPAFAWLDNVPVPATAKLPSVFIRRSVRIRLRAKRPWLSAGEGERLGIVIWPPNLFDAGVGDVVHDMIKPPPSDRKEINLRTLPDDGTPLVELQDSDLGPGGSWVTRWGADPIRGNAAVQGWLLSKDNFPGYSEYAGFASAPPNEHPSGSVLVKNVLMPIPADADAPELRVANAPGGFMVVSLITYAPRFDPDQETWYADVDLNPCGAAYPFVRFGLVRFQPNARADLQVSEPIVEWAQIRPERQLSATARYLDARRKEIEITAVVSGIASGTADNGGHPESASAQAPRVYFSLRKRRIEQGDELPGSEVSDRDPQIGAMGCGYACGTWTTTFRVGADEFARHAWSVFAEEVERMRPATYADEPRYQTVMDSKFVDTGPQFAARLALDNLMPAN